MTLALSIAEIRQAATTIAPHVCRTPLRVSSGLSQYNGAEVLLKLETMQNTGAFKLRGATNKLLSLDDAERSAGVIAVSTGNHGRGVAFAAAKLGLRAVVCMSELVPTVKVEAIRALGAEMVITGKSQDEAEETALAMISELGLVYVSPFDDRHVIAGQGTIGLELMAAVPALDTIIVPVSGGGLIGGISVAAKALRPDVRIVGVTMDRGAAMYESIKVGKPVQVEEMVSLADSLGGGIGSNNRYTFDLVHALVDDMVLVTEAQIADAMAWLYWNERIVAEGAGAVGVAALLNGFAGGGRTVAIVSGCNVDMTNFTEIVRERAP